MQSKSVSYLKDPECLQIKIELSKMKKFPVELINHIVDNYVNNCCLICKKDREYLGCYVCKESDKCGNVCLQGGLEICNDCARHSCSGRGPVQYCTACEDCYCTGEKGCRSSIRECNHCNCSYCNKHDDVGISTCAICNRLLCGECDAETCIYECKNCPIEVCDECGHYCQYCENLNCPDPTCVRFCISCETWVCTSCKPLNNSLCHNCASFICCEDLSKCYSCENRFCQDCNPFLMQCSTCNTKTCGNDECKCKCFVNIKFICEDNKTPLKTLEVKVDKTKPLLEAYSLLARKLELPPGTHLRGYLFGYLNSYYTLEKYHIGDENQSVHIKIYSDKEASQSMVIKTCLNQGEKLYFRIKRCDPLSQIINYISKTKNVPAEKCLTQFRGQPILPEHSVLHIGVEENDMLHIEIQDLVAN